MSNTTTLEQQLAAVIEGQRRQDEKMQAISEQLTIMQAEQALLPIATGKAFWEKRDGILLLMGKLFDLPPERVEKVIATKCVYSWEESVPPNWMAP